MLLGREDHHLYGEKKKQNEPQRVKRQNLKQIQFEDEN